MWALFCNAFLIRLSDFRLEITLEFAGPVFSRSPLLKATDAMFWRHTAFVCGGNPCSEGLSSHVQFLVSVPNLQAGVTPTQNEWIEKPGSFNSKIHVGLGVSSSRNGVSGSRGVFFPGIVFSGPGRVFLVPTKVCLVPTVFWVPAWVFWVPTSSTRPGLKNPCSIITPGCY